MILYRKKPVVYSIFEPGFTLDASAKKHLRETVFADGTRSKQITLLINGKQYKAKLLNALPRDSEQGGNGSVQIKYLNNTVQELFKEIFSSTYYYYLEKRSKAESVTLSDGRVRK
ncbi:MAG: hypothetical protein PHI27_02045 [Eubacteriales bacterium]|nr:hypothetical protein [Eubacteriales bacterium]MDD3881014.1 hypothetical protein [Eubacteriales bacterium]MDD4511917.1 hypothetical protein [Eubacteriales bacterium]